VIDTDKRSFDEATGEGIGLDLSQKAVADVYRHRFRVSENVCHDGGFLMCPTLRLPQRLDDTFQTNRRPQPCRSQLQPWCGTHWLRLRRIRA
jgi:hypothetical protein